ncbi:MAG: F0F1 ATP synthase subunit delta [Glaciimonas sp.]|nr:F0F1 ATP synthase subunit delta [Glaciimonas sp.]
MAELATIARPYAVALFRVAKDGNLSAWSERLFEMAHVAAIADVQALAHNPNVSAKQIAAAFLSVLKSPVNEEARNFIGVLTDNRRLTLLPEIAVQFDVLKNADEGTADVEITSAFELTKDQVQGLTVTLEKKFGRKLRPTVTVDSSLIGGVRVMVGDEVLDTSVRAKLQQMQAALAA